MENNHNTKYMKGFLPYALAAFMVSLVGGFATLLGTSFVKDIGIPYNNTTWMTLAMSISGAACAPILGKMIDIIGRRPTLFLGISIFTMGNILTASAQTLPFMLLARFVVGVGTAAVAPLVMSYIISEFPHEETAKGFSLYMLISSIAVVFGPTLGGFIIRKWGWRTMMWICVLICILVLVICIISREYGTHVKGSIKGFDFTGAIFVIFFATFMLCTPSFGQNFGWTSSGFIIVAILGIISLIGLVLVEHKVQNPLLPGSFILRKTFILPVLALFLTQGLLQANTTNTIVFVNYTQPDNAIISSYAISIMYLGMSLGSVFLGPLADRFEPKYILTGSLLLTGIGCGMMFFYTQQTPVFFLCLALGILGFGLGANATVFMEIVLHDLPEEMSGAGTGTYGLFRDLTAPFGVAVLVPMFTNLVAEKVISGTSNAAAAVGAIHSLSITEILCVALGIGIVLMLPKIYNKKR